MRHRQDPRIIRAKFDSICPETGKQIKKGDNCVYYPQARKVYHIDSKQAESFSAWAFDVECLGANY